MEKSVPYFPEKYGSENSAPLMAEYSAGGLRKVSRPSPLSNVSEVRESAKADWVKINPEARREIIAQIDQELARKPTAAEIAAKFGIKTGATIEEVEPRCDPESGYIAPVSVACAADRAGDILPHIKRDWRKFYIDLDETEPMEASVEFKKATEGIKLPVGFLKMPKSRQIAWLTENA